jgi:hypothetical protein
MCQQHLSLLPQHDSNRRRLQIRLPRWRNSVQVMVGGVQAHEVSSLSHTPSINLREHTMRSSSIHSFIRSFIIHTVQA